MAWLQGVMGLGVMVALAWGISEDRRGVAWRLVGVGMALQLLLALLLLKAPLINAGFQQLNRLVVALQEATTAGTSFVFGYLGGGDAPYEAVHPQAAFILAFQALPLVLLMSALSALLFHWRVLPLVVRGFSLLLQRSLGIGGALGLGVAANVFVGMVEAPLLVRPYLRAMSRGELFALMTCGMATIAGTMMALYAAILGPVIPDALAHILTASLLSAPAAVVVAGVMVPHGGERTEGALAGESHYGGAMDAVARGTADGVTLLLHIIAMLVVLVGLVALANQTLGLLPGWDGAPLTLQRLLGWLLSPLGWLMGIPWEEAAVAGELLGIKTILNEFLAYLQLAQLPEGTLTERSRLILTYALCGFANLGSLGIMLGGMGAMVPERRGEIAALGIKSIIAGTLATCMTGAVVGLLL